MKNSKTITENEELLQTIAHRQTELASLTSHLIEDANKTKKYPEIIKHNGNYNWFASIKNSDTSLLSNAY